jgi:hypothetical protein
MGQPFFRQLAGEFQLKRLFPSFFAGLMTGILTIIIEISLAALIFSGDLSRFVSNGIGITLFSSVVIGVVVALTSSLRGAVAVGQDIPAAILAPVAAGIVASHRDRFPDDGYFPVGGLDTLYSLPGYWRFPGRDGLAAGQRVFRRDG